MASTLTKIGGNKTTAAGQTTIVAALSSDIQVGDAAWIAVIYNSGTAATAAGTDSQGQTWVLEQGLAASGTGIAFYRVLASTKHLVAGTDTITLTMPVTMTRTAYTVLKLSGGGPVVALDQLVTGHASALPATKTTAALAQTEEVAISVTGWHDVTSGGGGDTYATDTAHGWAALDLESATLNTANFYLGVDGQTTSATTALTSAPTIAGTAPVDWCEIICTYELIQVATPGVAAHASAGYTPTLAPTGHAPLAPGVASHASAGYTPSLTNIAPTPPTFSPGGGPVTRRQASDASALGVSVKAISATWGQPTLAGSLLVAAVAIGGAQPSSVQMPLGWVPLFTPTTFGGIWLFAMIDAPAQSGVVTAGWNGAGRHVAMWLGEYVGASTDPIEVVQYNHEGLTTMFAGKALTVKEAGAAAVGFIQHNYNEDQTLQLPFGQWAQPLDLHEAGGLSTSKPSLGVYERTGIPAGGSALVYATTATAQAWHALMLVIRPMPPNGFASYTVSAQWEAVNTGLFIVGTSKLGSTDKIGAAFGSGVFDALPEATSVTITRGQSDPTTPVAEGQATITLFDADGKFNPTNTGSPLYPNVIPMRPIRVQAVFGGVTYERFNGFLINIYDDVSKPVQQATIFAGDAFEWLNNAYPVISTMTSTTTGAAIAAVLTALRWPPANQMLDAGDNIPTFSADGTISALQVIQNLLEAERGTVFIDVAGNVVYQDRHHQFTNPVEGTVSNTMSGMIPGVDLQDTQNRATVTRQGGVQQQVSDGISQGRFGIRDVPPITTVYLNSDAQALALAQYLVAQRKNPTPPVWSLTLVAGRDPGTTQQILARDLGDAVTIVDSQGGTSGEWVIIGITETISQGGTSHICSWTLAAKGSGAFVIGRSTLGGSDFITY